MHFHRHRHGKLQRRRSTLGAGERCTEVSTCRDWHSNEQIPLTAHDALGSIPFTGTAIGEVFVRVDRAELRSKRAVSLKMPIIPKHKTAKRRTEFKSSSWYQTSAQSLAIPLDRRDQH